VSAPTSLSEAWELSRAEAPIDPRATPAVQARRDYMSGSLDTLVLLKNGATWDQLMAECMGFARAIGTPAERAA
jgi:hypothetical protein